MRTELIIATYNSPRALKLCLASVARQTLLPDSIAIADDGSGPETAAAIADLAAAHPGLAIRHVWHEDEGFRKAAILNKAIASSDADFLIFIDGDVMIHPGFVARHVALSRPDRFSSGSLIRLDAEATAKVTESDVSEGRVFEMGWLKQNRAIDRTGTWLKAMPFPMPVQAALDALSPVQRAWGGSNASAFRDAILRVNGFDETMRWGGGDKELGIRLANSGVRGRHLRFTAPLVHLDHPRSYADPEHKRANRERLRARQREGVTWTPDGISKGAPVG